MKEKDKSNDVPPKFERMSDEERHQRYLKYLGIDEKTYQEIFKDLGVDVEEKESGGVLLDLELPDKDSSVTLGLNAVRSMGMIIDPGFLGEIRVNGIIVEFKFRLAKRGELPSRYLRNSFK